MEMTRVNFYDTSHFDAGKLTYSVIAALYKGRWIFVRHINRTTWEIPGGHIEKGESPDEAGERELEEETGALEFKLTSVADYSVEKDGTIGYGRLYFAEVSKLGPIKDRSEIAEITLSDQLPEDLTYPDIQPHLFRKASGHRGK